VAQGLDENTKLKQLRAKGRAAYRGERWAVQQLGQRWGSCIVQFALR
jgi:hypothetical protein